MTSRTATTVQGGRRASDAPLALPTDRWRAIEIAFWLVVVAAYFVFPKHHVLGSQILITGLFAVSLDLILGYAGIVSLGHAAFFGIGAYTSTILLLAFGLSPWIGMLVGGVFGGFAAFVIAIPTMRLQGHYFALATLAMTCLGADIVSAFSGVAATLGNVGPGLGSLGPMDNYSGLPALGKWVLSLCMLLGRLELYTVIMLVFPATWRQ